MSAAKSILNGRTDLDKGGFREGSSPETNTKGNTPCVNTSGDGDHWVTGHGWDFSARAKVIRRNEKGLDVVLLQGSVNTISTCGVINIRLSESRYVSMTGQ